MAVRYAVPPIVTNGLVLYLDAANRQSYVSGSTTWYDLSGRNNNWNASSNIPTFIQPPTGTPYLSFNNTPSASTSLGSSLQYFTRPNNNSDDIGGLGRLTDVSLEFWYMVNYLVDDYQPLYEKGWGDQLLLTALSYTTSSAQPQFGVVNSYPTNQMYISGSISASTGSWCHVIGTYDRNTMKIYQNSILTATASYTNNASSAAYAFSIGANYGNPSGGNTRCLHGFISVARFYNRALTQAEVLQNYNATKARFGL